MKRKTYFEKDQLECEFRVARNYYEQNKSNIETDQRYKGKFIAIVGDRIVDADEDHDALDKRLDENYPKSAVMVVGVGVNSFVNIPMISLRDYKL